MSVRKFVNTYGAFLFLLIGLIGWCISDLTPAVQSYFELKNGFEAQKVGDYSKAMGFYLESANKRNSIAEQNIGILYAKGMGVQRNYEEALKWLLRSQNDGNKNAPALISQVSLMKKATEN